MNSEPEHEDPKAVRSAADALRRIPVVEAAAPAQSACEGGESFALQVLGDDMAPEFGDGDVIVVEPGGLVADGAYVVARHDGEWLLRRLQRDGEGWLLVAEAPGVPPRRLASVADIRGVVIQKVRPGRRRERKRYIE